MPRFKLTLEYAGTRYSGWQKQTNARTVQGELERAIVAGLGDVLVDSQGSGRTDAGVHALAQVAHVDLVRAPALEQLRRRINDELPADVHVLDAAPVSAQVPRPPQRGAPQLRLPGVAAALGVRQAVRVVGEGRRSTWRAMQAVAAGFVGRHDFQAFSDDDPDEKSTLVELDEVTVTEAGPLLLVRVAGSHFLWKMVRRMVGVLVAAGTGALPPARASPPGSPIRARRAATSRRGSPPRRPACSSSGSSTRATLARAAAPAGGVR